MALTYDIAGAQIDGARDYQEDAFLITNLKDKDGNPSSLVIVADGMGGHAAGNVASNMAVQAFNKHVSSNYPSNDIGEVLNGAVLKANHSIAETVKETAALEGMGCTMVAALIEKNKIWRASVGDSHLYLIRNRELSKINADHSYGGFLDAMEAAGTPVEPEPGLSRNMLMSAITGSDISEVDCPSTSLQLEAGDKILICSDGMDTLSEGKIIQYCEWSDSPKECADALLNAVEEADMPKQDNTTVVVIHVIDKDAVSEPVEEDDDDDDEDITDTSGAHKKPDLDRTAEVSGEETGQDANIDDTPPQGTSVDMDLGVDTDTASITDETVAAATPAVEESKSSKLPLIIGAVVVLCIAGGGYFMLVGGDKSTDTITEADISVAESEPEAVPEITETEDVASDSAGEETEPGVVEETETKVEDEIQPEIAEEPPATKTTPKTEAAPAPVAAPATAQSGVIQDTLKDGSKGPVMVIVPAGSFEMGSKSATNADERPRHSVKVASFAISEHEITFAEYDKFAAATDRKLPDNLYMDRETHPVIFVSWDDVYNYTKWLSEQTGQKYRLPSEAEWEYAASGGQNSSFWWGFEEKDDYAHCFTCNSQYDPRKPTKIGSFKPNQFGLYDTAGNVAEWVHDCWHSNYSEAPTDGSIWEGGDCSQRVARGGSYISPQQSIRHAKRDKFKSNAGYDHVGIRLVRELK